MKALSLALTLLVAGGARAWAQSSELEQVKAAMQLMQKTMEEMQKKIAELEKEKTNAAAPAPSAIEQNSQSYQTLEKVAAGKDIGSTSPVGQRPSFNDQQEAAQRPKDLTLDPKYRGFFPIPNTPALIKFNAKPRVDMTSDNRNSGNVDRFATAQIPVKGQSGYGGSERFNVNARGSQLSVDVRAPEMDGNFRFYYNNDFFGSGNGMQYRLKQMYGQFYNITAGFTYSCFEDPDAWPDTVDYEGPNSVIFARRALVRYMVPLCDSWQMNFGIEAPGSEVDGGTNSISQVNSAPDGTMNIRWENAKWGHVQLGSVFRSIGADGSGVGNQSVFGWGLNLASSINVFKRDSFQTQITYGEGIFRYMNDDFINNDAAYDNSGSLKPIQCFGAMGGYTHQWTDTLRTTMTYGYVRLENQASQGPDAYNQTHYGSLNLIWQLRKKLSIGWEGLYGKKETQNGENGDVWRVQMSLMYSLFD